MKNMLIAILLFAGLGSFAQPWETVKGNGQVKTESREVGEFSALSSRGSMDVIIDYGNSNSITVEADENLLPYIETSVENGKLTIKSKSRVNLKSSHRMIVKVSMTKINSLQESGSGNISGSGAFTSDANTDISVSGSGNLKLEFDSFKDLNLSISGSGNVDLKKGNTNSLTAKISGSGNIDCSSVKSDDVDAKISGSGNIRVYAMNSIKANISGSGNVYYRGNAQNINVKAAGSGKILKM